MSFGRSVRYRRTKLGLSQTRLGELVGRSAAAVRSWERESSIPSDPSVLEALSAVLGIDKVVLFAKAGIEAPLVESSPTVEEALGTLAPPRHVRPSAPRQESIFRSPIPTEEPAGFPGGDRSEDFVSVSYTPISPSGDASSTTSSPAYTAPIDPFVLTVPAPPVIEPSYMEDEAQRQMYRIRNLATLVLGVALLVLLIWAFANAWDELNSWWDEFVGQMRL